MPSPRSRRRAAKAPEVGPTALQLQTPHEQLSALRQEHERLLGKVAARKKKLHALFEELRDVGSQIASQLEPLHIEYHALDQAIHAAFAELLQPGRQSRRHYNQIIGVYQMLQNDGMITPSAADTPEAEEEPFEPPASAGGFTARRPSDHGPVESLRDLYRRLAGAIHPDKVQDEDEKARRTEAMKEVTRAYGDGDLARLLEIERNWRTSDDVPARTDAQGIEERCAGLEQINRELRAQLAALDGELRQIRRSPRGRMASDLKRSRQHGGDSLADLTEEARGDLARLREIRDFVYAFRDGQISLARFLAGPEEHEPHDDPEADLLQLLAQLAAEAPRGKRRPRKRPSARG